MRLRLVVDTIVGRLDDHLDGSVAVGDGEPVARGDLPAVTVSVVTADPVLSGVGGLPSGPRSGALATRDVVDLAEPTVTIGGERVDLLSDDRRRLVLLHGPVVSADGTSPPPPLDGDDVSVTTPDGAASVVPGDPAAGEVHVDAVEGRLVFGEPLPAAGDVEVDYHVGTWDVTVVRFTGTLAVDVHDDDPDDLAALTRDVAEGLTVPPPGFDHLRPTAWGPATVRRDVPGQGPAPLAQRLTYSFSFEREVPALATSGGLIRAVGVASDLGDGVGDTEPPSSERFEIPIGAGLT